MSDHGTSQMKQFLTVFILLAFVHSTLGCYSSHRFLVDDRQQIKEPQRIYRIKTTDGQYVSFESDSLGYAVLNDTTLQRYLSNGVTETIPLSTVQVLYTQGPDPKRTGIAILLGFGVIASIYVAIVSGLRAGSWH
jgi:hypothetical protein